jgi:hypothetical protein
MRWGGNCKECATVCTGHYLTPKEHAAFVNENGDSMCVYKPPSAIIKEEFYKSLKENKALSMSLLQEVAQKTLLSLEDLTMHVDHLRATAQQRKEGARKAALTRKAKKAERNKETRKAETNKETRKAERNKETRKATRKLGKQKETRKPGNQLASIIVFYYNFQVQDTYSNIILY